MLVAVSLGLLLTASEVTPARAQAVLPAGSQGKLLRALRPLKPGGLVVAPWRLRDIAIRYDRVDIELIAANGFAVVRLVPSGAGDDPVGLTPSFDVELDRLRVANEAPELDLAAQRIVTALRANDRGDFYRGVVTHDDPTATAAPSRAPPGPAIPIQIVIGVGLLVALLLAASDRHAVLEAHGARTPWRGLAIGVGLFVTALALRALLGPGTFLHENGYGPRQLEEIAGLRDTLRPMAGLVGLHRLLDPFFAPSFERLIAVGAVTGALHAPLSYLVGRAIGLAQPWAAVAGALVATLPLAIRMSASELAFAPATALVLLAVWAVAVAVRAGSGRWLVASLILIALAGHFRPVLYTLALPVGLGWLALPGPIPLRRRLTSPWPYLAVVAYAVTALDDFGPLTHAVGEGVTLYPGWWRQTDLAAWPLLDPSWTPPWIMPLALAGAGLAVWRGARAATLWLASIGALLTFLLTADNGHPAALRYALAYAWVPPLLIAVGLAAVPWKARARPAVVLLVALLVAVPPLLWVKPIGRLYAQQHELRFQRDEMLGPLTAARPGVVITPWRELDLMAGSLLSHPVRRAGHQIVPVQDAAELLARLSPDRPVFWYRGLTCWSRPRAGASGRYDPRGLNEQCAAVDAMAAWVPVVTLDLPPQSDADWIRLGDGDNVFTVGLYRHPGTSGDSAP